MTSNSPSVMERDKAMWQGGAALLDDRHAATWRASLTVGDAVRVKCGTEDPDFPGRRLDGWTGTIIDRDEMVALTQYLVQWDDATVGRMPVDDRDRCRCEDMILDQMWLLEDDMDHLTLERGVCDERLF